MGQNEKGAACLRVSLSSTGDFRSVPAVRGSETTPFPAAESPLVRYCVLS